MRLFRETISAAIAIFQVLITPTTSTNANYFRWITSTTPSLESRPPSGCVLGDCDTMMSSEVTEDFNYPHETQSTKLFEDATHFEWDRADKIDPETEYSFLLCDSESGKSGILRKTSIRSSLYSIGVDTIMVPLYNKIDIKSCWFISMTENNAMKFFASLSEDKEENISMQPVISSMKMHSGFVDEVGQKIDSSLIDDDLELSIRMCPTSNLASTNGVEMGNAILDSIIKIPDQMCKSSFFHHLYQEKNENGINATYSHLTERIEFWGSSLEDSFSNSNSSCSELLKKTVLIREEVWGFRQSGYSISFTLQPNVLGKNCTWGVIQGIALNPMVCGMTQVSQMRFNEPIASSSAFSIRNLFYFTPILTLAVSLMSLT